jgi:nucleoid-associated protein YgaU
MTNNKVPMISNKVPASGRFGITKRELIFGLLLAALGVFYFTQHLPNLPDFNPATREPVAAVSAKPAHSAPALPAPGFDALSADDMGMLVAAGHGPAGFSIALKNGAQIIGETRADESGEWVLTPEKPLPSGDYAFTLEATDASSGRSVQSKKALAFTIVSCSQPAPRSPRAPAAVSANALPKPETHKKVAVTRGDTLWDLARRQFGDARRYPEIAAANKEQIKNPDLIYPRQEFEIPQK